VKDVCHDFVQHSGQPLLHLLDSSCSVCCCPVADTLSLAVVCTSAIGSLLSMGLISASSTCASFPDLLLVSCSCDSVLLLSVSHADVDVDNFKRCCTSYTFDGV
ncbi:hypothetical protein Tco_0176428, partial [Tanacetum coccineum]